MRESMDQRLTRAAHQVAERLTTPEVDLEAVRAGARVRPRRRNLGVAAAALVLVAAVGTAVVSGRDGDRTLPADAPGSGAAPAGAVWLDGNGLHHGTDTMPVDLPLGSGEVVVALVRSGALYVDRTRGDVWFHPWDGEPHIVGRDSESGPGGDPQGDIAAWFEGDVLVVYDTALGREVSRTNERTVDGHVLEEHVRSGNGFVHLSDDEVVWTTGRDHDASTLRGTVYRLDLRTGVSAQLGHDSRLKDVDDGIRLVSTPTNLTLEMPGESPSDLGRVEPVGRLGPDGSFVLAPSIVGLGVNHGVVIIDATGVTWNVLDEEFYGWPTWAYGDTAMVEVDTDEGSYLLACDASDRSCVRVDTEGRLSLANP